MLVTAKVYRAGALVFAIGLFLCIDRLYQLAESRPYQFVLLWLLMQGCAAASLSSFVPLKPRRDLERRLFAAVLIGGFMGGVTLPKVIAAIGLDGLQLPAWFDEIPYPAILVTGLSQAIIAAALEAAIWGLAYVVPPARTFRQR